MRKENHGKKNTVEIIKLAKEQLNITDDPSDDYDIYAEEKRMKQSAYMRRGSKSKMTIILFFIFHTYFST